MNSNGSPSPSTSRRRQSPATTTSGGREDCWSEDATFTLIEAWGDSYLECNRGNLRQKHWQQVADTVNRRHRHPTRRRSDVQCKNRIDTLKKKFKVEKSRLNNSAGNYVSPWPFFSSLDALIGSNFTASPVLAFSTPVPVGPRSATVKRPARVTARSWLPEMKFSAFAAAAAAVAEEEEGLSSRSGSSGSDRKRKKFTEAGLRELAEAVERFTEIYERVEGEKQKQMFELEKQRMQFAKDLEFQRMQFFMETQIQLQKVKGANDSSANGNY